MQSTLSRRLATLSLLVTALGCSFLPASADDVIMQQTTTSTGAAQTLAPGSDVTTTTTTGVGKYNVPISTTTTRSTVMDPGPTQQVTEKNTVYTRLSPADASQTMVETKSSDSIKYGRPNYALRLKNMRSQLDEAVAKSWITSAQAADFNSQYESLAAQEASVSGHGYNKEDSNALDARLNEFNIQLSGAMSKAGGK